MRVDFREKTGKFSAPGRSTAARIDKHTDGLADG
jgi:hypothetical protein